MSAAFNRVVPHVLHIEGAYSNDPDDSGGETNWGITKAVARAFGYQGRMRDLTQEQALSIYKQRYWDLLRLDDVAALSEPIALELFDTSVNVGQDFAGTCLQRCLNALNREQSDYPDAKVDGLVGKLTIYSLRLYLQKRGKLGEQIMLRALNCLQGCKYIGISENNPTQEKFLNGWLGNRVTI